MMTKTNITRRLSTDEALDWIHNNLRATAEPSNELNEFTDTLNNHLNNKTEATKNEVTAKGKKVLMNESLTTHIALLSSISQEYHGYALEITNGIISDYKCKKAIEITLVHTLVIAYIKMLETNSRLRLLSDQVTINSPKNNYFSILSKEFDRAYRQYITSVNTLQSLKLPPLKIHLKSKQAFIGQNVNLSPKINNGQ